MLDISADKVGEIIILAREDRGERELDAFINALNEEEQVSLVALFWIGRGTFEASELADAIRTARGEATTSTSSYLKQSPHLADHLEAGLAALGFDPTNVEGDLYRPV